ncbi:acetylcholine receptor subunit alpha-like 2 [Brachionus plicatilis]|uniref:Acetylcholine receptor subunit alpha-like 2 n=1 Tax=Brachionus plicatilis TaxID=10195 RepID=A0A3M7QCY8_BRAPC|nr:acetylcholine receptor subunit alpha-like 2 [Brachionus plicatilis]
MNKLIMPYCFFYIVALLTYIVPVESGEKKSYSTSILISGMMYLKDISDLIPKTSHLPMLSIYFNLNLVFVSICIMLTTIIYLVYYNYKTKTPIAGCLKVLVQRSRFVTDEKKLFKTNLSNFEMENIRKRLMDLNKNLFVLNQFVDEGGKNEECVEDLIGNEVLSLVKTLKMYIVRKNDLKMSIRKNCFTRENVDNSKYLNTLENLKFNLIKSNAKVKTNECIDLNQRLDHFSNGLMETKKAKFYLENLELFKKSIRNYINSIQKPKDIHNFTRYLQNQMNNDQILVHQWKYLAMLIDRFVFLFFAVVTPMSLISILFVN